MSRGDNTPGMSKFVGAIDEMIGRRKDTSLIIDYGVIQDDYSLLTNTFPIPVPKADYMCCRHLKEVPSGDRWSTSSGGSPSHSHKFQPHWKLDKGDRVLVAWVQNDPVVIDVLVHGDEVFT